MPRRSGGCASTWPRSSPAASTWWRTRSSSAGEQGPDQERGDDRECSRDHDVVGRPAPLLPERVEPHAGDYGRTMGSFETLKVERGDGVVTVTMNRPEKKNAIDAQMTEGLIELLTDVKTTESDRGLILTGAG